MQVPADMSANSDNVPSFAAKMFIVREAPPEFYPPNYRGDANARRRNIHVQIPRTKFYCEDQKYLPGIYADAMLGCKVIGVLEFLDRESERKGKIKGRGNA